MPALAAGIGLALLTVFGGDGLQFREVVPGNQIDSGFPSLDNVPRRTLVAWSADQAENADGIT